MPIPSRLPQPIAEAEEPVIELDADAGLADRLWAARESAEVCKQQDGRSRAALYRALAMAYDFAVAAKRVPDDYAEILDDAGVKAQARAPMTPIVKLVFGVDYDKTRLTEFAAALSYAERENIDFGGFQSFVEQAEGGLKGLVAAERKARRPDKPVEDKVEAGKTALRTAAATRAGPASNQPGIRAGPDPPQRQWRSRSGRTGRRRRHARPRPAQRRPLGLRLPPRLLPNAAHGTRPRASRDMRSNGGT